MLAPASPPVASTFKILNTLIGLETGAISGQGSEFKWDGTRHEISDWNHDQTLASAFKVSCVWCYQQLATSVGADTYRKYLQLAGYGPLREPFDLTRFWLDGSLQVSAEEQIALLRKLYQRSLPFSTRSYDTLRQVMLAEQGTGYRLYAKTGWAASQQPQTGWYVGYVENGSEVWLFAGNIDIDNASQLPLRQALTLEALRLKGAALFIDAETLMKLQAGTVYLIELCSGGTMPLAVSRRRCSTTLLVA